MTKKKGGARKLSAADKRTMEICLAAAGIIHKKGFNATSMNNIAEAVKLTKAGLYYYASSKHELLYKIISYAMDKIEADVVAPSKNIDEPVRRLQMIIHTHVRLMLEAGGALTILTEEVSNLSGPHRRAILKRKRDYLDVVRGTLEELKAAGRLRELDTMIASLNIFATILGAVRWYRRKGKFSPERIADEISEFILGGLLSSP